MANCGYQSPKMAIEDIKRGVVLPLLIALIKELQMAENYVQDFDGKKVDEKQFLK